MKIIFEDLPTGYKETTSGWFTCIGAKLTGGVTLALYSNIGEIYELSFDCEEKAVIAYAEILDSTSSNEVYLSKTCGISFLGFKPMYSGHVPFPGVDALPF